MDPDQLARATAALDVWFDPGPGGYRAPGLTWDQRELESMHAALEAPTTDAALEAFPGAPGSWLSTPEQDAENRALMGEVRRLLGCDAGTVSTPYHTAAEARQAAGTCLARVEPALAAGGGAAGARPEPRTADPAEQAAQGPPATGSEDPPSAGLPMSEPKNTQNQPSSSPIPWLTPQEYADYKAAYAAELAADPSADAGQLLRRAGERTPQLWGIRVAPDGTTVINPDRLSPETRTGFERTGLIPQPPHQGEAIQPHAQATAAHAKAAQGHTQENLAGSPGKTASSGRQSPNAHGTLQGVPGQAESPAPGLAAGPDFPAAPADGLASSAGAGPARTTRRPWRHAVRHVRGR